MGAIALLTFLLALIIRCIFPYPLWVLEDEVFIHTERLRSGLEVYPPWGGDFVSLIYPPLYYCIGTLFISVSNNIAALRLVSVISLLTFFVISWLMMRRANHPAWTILVVLGFLSCISPNLGGCWEQVKIDGLMLALVLAGVFLLVVPRNSRRYIIPAGILFGLAFFAKQTAGIFILAALIFLWFEKREMFAAFLASMLSTVLVLGIILLFLFGPSIIFYCIVVPLMQEFHIVALLQDIVPLWLGKFALIILFALGGWILALKEAKGSYSRVYLYFLPASFLAYALPRCKYAGYIFNFLHFGVFACLAAGYFIWRTVESRNTSQEPETRKMKDAVIIVLVIFIAFAFLFYNPLNLLPNKDNYMISQDAVKAISDIEGEAYLPIASYYGYISGKDVYASHVAIKDASSTGIVEGYPEGLLEKIRNGEIQYILVRIEDILTENSIPLRENQKIIYCGFIVDIDNYQPNPEIMLPPIRLYRIVTEDRIYPVDSTYQK